MQEPRTEKMISQAKHKYDGVWLKRGDPFNATQQDAEDLECMKFATRAPAQTYQTRVMVAADPATVQVQAVESAVAGKTDDEQDVDGKKPSTEAPQKRAYTRRDVTSATK